MLARLKQRLRAGVFVKLGAFELTLLRVQRAAPPAVAVAPQAAVVESEPAQAAAVDLATPAVRLLLERFPELRALELPLLEPDAALILETLYSVLPAMNAESRGAALRSALVRLRDQASSAAVTSAAARAIAISDLADGLPDRARILRDDQKWGQPWREQVAAFEAAYGASIISVDWSESSRGAALLWFFEQNPEFAAGRDVLHIAPEPELQPFLRSAARSYVTLDAAPGPGIQLVADLCHTGREPNEFDLVVCHRVLEHVVDDAAAIRELHRVLRPGGLLQVSVPQAPHRAPTVEWLVPDRSHHDHVRHYGADFVARLERAGFAVKLEYWLLRQPEEALRQRRAYPMRFFWARKETS